MGLKTPLRRFEYFRCIIIGMKRLNPKTCQPFSFGDMREDGYVFSHYQINCKPIKKDGYYRELWIKPKVQENSKRRSLIRNKEARTTPIGRARELIRNAQFRANRDGGEVTITTDWVVDRIKAGRCELSGLPFDLNTNLTRFNNNPQAPSLDKIDSANKNYTPENTRVVLYMVNVCIGEYGLDSLLALADNIRANMGAH